MLLFAECLRVHTQKPSAGVLRYRMDGYSTASVTPLPNRYQILTDHAVETTADGSLIVRFKRPLLEAPRGDRDACAAGATAAVEGGGITTAGNVVGDAGAGADGGIVKAATEGEVCSAAADRGMEWLDPRDEDVVLLWAYGRGGWPSYHDATGAFVLPRLEFS